MSAVVNASATTAAQMAALYELSDLLDALFLADNANEPLGRAMITFSRPSGSAKALGFYRPNGWVDENGVEIATIAINPETMALFGFVEVVQTLAHEKAHQWQAEHGKISRAGYHNIEWAKKMQRIGLMPSSTGAPGGKTTGPKMGDYVIKGGPLDRMLRALPKRLRLPFMGLPAGARPAKPSQGYARFECPSCAGVARAKPTMRLRCDECDELMLVDDLKEETTP